MIDHTQDRRLRYQLLLPETPSTSTEPLDPGFCNVGFLGF
jgi:hypothetical protein